MAVLLFIFPPQTLEKGTCYFFDSAEKSSVLLSMPKYETVEALLGVLQQN